MFVSHRTWAMVAAVVGSFAGNRTLADDAPSPGVSVTTFVTGLTQPLAMAIAPDWRMFVAEKGGAIRIVEDGALVADPFAELEVFAASECGLLGLALDPDFSASRYVYVFATVSNTEQRIYRLEERDGRAVNQIVLVDNLPTTGRNHNGGGLRIGPDRHLYFSIGDTGLPELSQSMTSLAGKVCRVALDGHAPTDNPFATPTGSPRSIFAMGFRNPFRFCFAGDGRMLVMDVGSDDDARREEINLVVAGGNHGWPMVEGYGGQGDFVDPLLAYHDDGASIAGCAAIEGDAFPAEYQGELFWVDFVSQSLFRARLDGNQLGSHSMVARVDGGPLDLVAGPDGSLYLTGFYDGSISRITFGDGGEVPQAGDQPADDPTPLSPPPSACGSNLLATIIMITFVLRIAWRRV